MLERIVGPLVADASRATVLVGSGGVPFTQGGES